MPNIGVNRNSAAHRTLRVVPLLVAIATTFLGLAFPSARLAAATDPLTLTPVADAWVNHQRPDSNYGSVAGLRTASGASESILRFSVSGWSGKLIGGLTLTIDGIDGNAATLVADQTTNGWKEASVNWRSRPSALRELGSMVGRPASTSRL